MYILRQVLVEYPNMIRREVKRMSSAESAWTSCAQEQAKTVLAWHSGRLSGTLRVLMLEEVEESGEGEDPERKLERIGADVAGHGATEDSVQRANNCWEEL